MTERDQWLADRRAGVGGSDCASMLNIGYGCRRSLWYDKRGTPEDYPREETDMMALGTHLEPFFAKKYADETGRILSEQVGVLTHPTIPELRVNVDRFIEPDGHRDDRGSGVLEIKSVGSANWYKIKREGLPHDYILQLQHGMLVTGCTWGAYAVGNRDTGKLLYWDVPVNYELHRIITEAVGPFWSMVQNGPAPDALEPDDKRCQSCAWRKTCQGNALIQLESTDEIEQDESLRPLLAEYAERKELLKQAEELMEDTTERLKDALGDRHAITAGDNKVYYRPQSGRTIYRGKELLEAYKKALVLLAGSDLPSPDKFIDTSKPSRPLRVY